MFFTGLDSFLNSSKLAEFAKDALMGMSGDLDSRLAALRKEEASPKKLSPQTISPQDIDDVHSPEAVEPAKDNADIWEIIDSRDAFDAHDSWDSRDVRDTRDSKESRSLRDTDERRDSEEIREVRDSWDRDSLDRRDYASIREHRNSRSSRDSRDSCDGISESREIYRSSSRDLVVSERDYNHKSRDREYSHTPSSSYDSPIQPPKVIL